MLLKFWLTQLKMEMCKQHGYWLERCVPSMRALDQNINVNDSVRGISDEELLSLMNEFELGTEVN